MARSIRVGPEQPTLDQFNRHWFIEFSAAVDSAHLAEMARVASDNPLWNGKLAKHVVAVLLLLSEPRAERVQL